MPGTATRIHPTLYQVFALCSGYGLQCELIDLEQTALHQIDHPGRKTARRRLSRGPPDPI